MIQREPNSRLSAKDYLTSWGPSLFPEYFTSFLQPFCQTLLPLSADLRLAAVQQAFPQMLHFMAPGTGAAPQMGVGGVSPLGSHGKSLALSAEPSQVESGGRGAGGLGSDSGDGSASLSTSAAATRPSSASRGYKSGGHPSNQSYILAWTADVNLDPAIEAMKTLGVRHPYGVARAQLTRDWQQSHHGKYCLFPKSLLLWYDTPNHGMLNGINQPAKFPSFKPQASKHANLLPVRNGLEKHDNQQPGRQACVSSTLTCICYHPSNGCCSSCNSMTVSHNCIKPRLSPSRL